MSGRRWFTRGVTLPELLIGVIVATLLTGVTVAILSAGMRVWRACSSLNQSFPPAYAVMNRINGDLANAGFVYVPTLWADGMTYSVGDCVVCRFDVGNTPVFQNYKCLVANTAATATNKPVQGANSTYWTQSYPWIVVYSPKLDTNGIVIDPLDVNLTGVKEYYLANSTGTHGTTGTYLWLRTFTQAGTAITVTSTKKLAPNVSKLVFYSFNNPATTTTSTFTINAMAISFLGTQNNTSVTSSFNSQVDLRNNPLFMVATPAMPVL